MAIRGLCLGMLLGSILFGISTQAEERWTCDGALGSDTFSISITQNQRTFVTQVSQNETPLPALGPCWTEVRASLRRVRCSHGRGTTRVEVYPYTETTSGAVKGPQAIVWYGNAPVYMTLNCD
ncbi:MAG: hypothetical protein AB7G93_15100 [Bdellovibrionales bacterium]